MSIDLNWETVTGGPDGLELAERIRDFIHTKFQSVPLPRFIKSVTVHDFQFGTIPPEVELKDITDPLPDFYEENPDIDGSESDQDGREGDDSDPEPIPDGLKAATDRRRRAGTGTGANGTRTTHFQSDLDIDGGPARSTTHTNDLGSPFLGVSTPGIPGGTSNLHYFHSQFANGLSGTQTPLAAVAGAHHLSNAWLESGHGHSASTPNLRQYRGHTRNHSGSSISIVDSNTPAPAPAPAPVLAPLSPVTMTSTGGLGPPQHPTLREKSSVSTLAPTAAGSSRPPTRDATSRSNNTITDQKAAAESDEREDEQEERRFRERKLEDMQAVFHIKYAGDVKLLLTADILLDYPMPSFVGIPLRLSITGVTFDGVGVLAKIRKRVHFCFLSPEDALAAIGGEENLEKAGEGTSRPTLGTKPGAKTGSLLQEIRVESEIGQRESGKQSLKNVGKVERFVLEQVRRIFEEEFVYPSFWTFLV